MQFLPLVRTKINNFLYFTIENARTLCYNTLCNFIQACAKTYFYALAEKRGIENEGKT